MGSTHLHIYRQSFAALGDARPVPTSANGPVCHYLPNAQVPLKMCVTPTSPFWFAAAPLDGTLVVHAVMILQRYDRNPLIRPVVDTRLVSTGVGRRLVSA